MQQDGTDVVTNQTRADAVMSAVQSFSDEMGLDPLVDLEVCVGDLVCNLMHLCDLNGLDFEEIAGLAKRNHDGEVADEARSGQSDSHGN